MFGFININKPSGMSSHTVVSRLRKILGIKQIGHAGTLDPLASGVLPIAIGKATKLIDYLPEDKGYIVEMYLGKVSDTYDTEGDVTETGFRKINLEEIKDCLKNFRGEIKQIPPAFSAVHYNGKRLYELARSGNIPDDIPSRLITVYKNEILDFNFELQTLKLDIECSKGTYIRSIVSDLGTALGCGAVMFSLIRTKSSGMSIDDSILLVDDIDKTLLEAKIINPTNLINLPMLELNSYELEKLKNGNKFKNRTNAVGELLLMKDGVILAFGIADREIVQPKKVFL